MNNSDTEPFRVSRAVLFLVFAAALIPRLWALDWALPLKTGHIDESVVVFYSLRVVAGDPNPRVFFDYPGFFLYVLAALFKGALLVFRFTGMTVPPNAQVLETYSRGDGLVSLLLIARAFNAVLSAAAGAVLCRFAGTRWRLTAGLAAGLLWAVNPLAVLHAHYATVDTAAVLLTLLAVERLARYADDGDRREGLWASVFVGLAAATKYYPGILTVFLAAVPLSRRDWRRAALFCAVAAGTFLAASPYTVIEAGTFAHRFLHLFPKIVGGGKETIYFLPTLKGLLSNVGLLTCLTSVAGLFLLFRSPSRGDRVLASVFIFLTIFFGVWGAQLPHYALPLYPLLFLAVGKALEETGRLQRCLPFVGLALLLGLAVPSTVRSLERISVPDTRLRALAWARETFPPGSRVLRFARTPEFSPRDPFSVMVDWENVRLREGAAALSAEGFDYLIYGTYDPVGDPIPKALAGRFALIKTIDAPAPFFPHDPAEYVYKVREK